MLEQLRPSDTIYQFRRAKGKWLWSLKLIRVLQRKNVMRQARSYVRTIRDENMWRKDGL